MLGCELAIVALGWRWRDNPTPGRALGFGILFAVASVCMTYTVPVAVFWILAMLLTGKGWIACQKGFFSFSLWTLCIAVAACFLSALIWPPGLTHRMFLSDFLSYLHYPSCPTLVGNHLYYYPTRSAYLYWFAHLDLPVLVSSLLILIPGFLCASKERGVAGKTSYFGLCLAFFLVIALKAHIAGARNLLQFIGILCLAFGAFFDDALTFRPRLAPFVSAVVVASAALNMFWLVGNNSYKSNVSVDGFKVLLETQRNVLGEKVKAMVDGAPILNFYAQQARFPLGWSVSEAWLSSPTPLIPDPRLKIAHLTPDIKYVLIPSFAADCLPEDHPLRSIVAPHWRLIWVFHSPAAWDLRLYQNPAI